MSPPVAEQLKASPEMLDDDLAVACEPIASAGHLPLPRPPLPAPPERMSIYSSQLAPLDAQLTVSAPSVVMRRPKPATTPRRSITDLLFFAGVFAASFALGALLMQL
jgi:hypothetical protein